jgi:hypothetical protein
MSGCRVKCGAHSSSPCPDLALSVIYVPHPHHDRLKVSFNIIFPVRRQIWLLGCVSLAAEHSFVPHEMITRSNFVIIEVVGFYLLICVMGVVSVLGEAWSIVPWAPSLSGPGTVPMSFLRSLAI